MPSSGRLIIVDNCLADGRGHHVNLSATLSHGAHEVGMDVVWYAHKSFARELAPDGVDVRRVFDRSSYDVLRQEHHTEDLSGEYLAVFHDILAADESRAARVLCHTADAHVYRALALIDGAGGRRNASQGPAFHIATPYEVGLMPGASDGASVDQSFCALCQSSWIEDGLYLWAETRRLAAYYQHFYGAPVYQLPLPVPHWADAGARAPSPDRRLHVVYLGAAREDKGFCLLPSLVAQAAADPQLTDKVRFTIQAAPPQRGYRQELMSAIGALQGFANVAMLPDNLDGARYQALIESSDVVLMLYDVKKYCARGSGIAIEALSAGKAILATPGLFLDEIAAEGAIAFGANLAEWLDVLRAWSADVPEIRARSRAASLGFARGRGAVDLFRRMERREQLGPALAGLWADAQERPAPLLAPVPYAPMRP